MNWLFNNWQILFGGNAGTAVVALIGWGLKRLFDSNTRSRQASLPHKVPQFLIPAWQAARVILNASIRQRISSWAYLQLLPRNALSRLNWSETWRNNHPVGFDRNVQG
jgi:hypothetical protein